MSSISLYVFSVSSGHCYLFCKIISLLFVSLNFWSVSQQLSGEVNDGHNLVWVAATNISLTFPSHIFTPNILTWFYYRPDFTRFWSGNTKWFIQWFQTKHWNSSHSVDFLPPNHSFQNPVQDTDSVPHTGNNNHNSINVNGKLPQSPIQSHLILEWEILQKWGY